MSSAFASFASRARFLPVFVASFALACDGGETRDVPDDPGQTRCPAGQVAIDDVCETPIALEVPDAPHIDGILGYAMCVVPELVLRDGRRVPAPAAGLRVELDDETVAVAAEAGDCPAVGLWPQRIGDGSVIVTFDLDDERALSTVLTFGVLDLRQRALDERDGIELTVNALVVPVGDTVSGLPCATRYEKPDGTPREGNGTIHATWVRRFMNVAVADASIVTPDDTAPQGRPGWKGVSRGITTADFTYDVPEVGVSMHCGPFTVVAPSSDTIGGVTIESEDESGAPIYTFTTLPPGARFDLSIMASMVDTFPELGQLSYERDVTDQATVTSFTSSVTIENVQRDGKPGFALVAGGRGEAIVEACAAGKCAHIAMPVAEASEITEVALVLASSTIPVEPTQICPKLAARITYRDGTQVDVSDSPALYLYYTPDGFPRTLDRLYATFPEVLRSAGGDACFAPPFSVAGGGTTTMHVSYGGVGSIPIPITFDAP